MTRISDLLSAGRTYSFEFFPPKTPEAEATLQQALVELRPLHPSYVSVTYGAGGSTRERTHDIVCSMRRDPVLNPMAHLTCISHTRDELTDIVSAYSREGVENLLALGGDVPEGATPGDLQYAIQLVQLIREVADFSIGVAAHPDVHPRSPDRESDRRHLAAKLNLADFAITQFFFEIESYSRLVDEMQSLGVDKPVIPGVMPITNVSQVERFAALSGTPVPPNLAAQFHALADDAEAVRKLGVEVATRMCEMLLERGAPGLHFYTLNRSTATREIYAALGLGS